MCLGIPGRIVEIVDTANLTAKVDISGVKREVNLACIVQPNTPLQSYIGDWVIVHVGFAMSRIDEQEAARTLQLLAELNQMQEELSAMQGATHEIR